MLVGCGSTHTASNTTTVTRHRAPPTPRKVKGPHRAPVPVLMYHVIGTAPPGSPNPGLFVAARTFTAQMRDLARRGYHGVTLGPVFDHWRRSYALPSKPVVVSFDDGYAGQFTNALPVLRRLGWPAVLNLAVHNETVAGGMDLAKLRKLVADRWEIDAHTIHHVDVTTLDAAGLRREIAGSRQIIRRQLRVPVAFFCYPSGRFDAAAIAAVKRAGYLGATTTQTGLARPSTPYTLDRIRIDSNDGAGTPAEKISAAGG